MKIVVTGGAGFIGSHLTDAYIRQGYSVVVLDNLSTGKKENVNPQATFYEIDIQNPEVKNILEKERPSFFSHHAAQIDVRRSVADPQLDVRVNIGGTINLLEACRNIPLQKFIFASSGGAIYGEQSHFPAQENHPLNPMSPYGINKLGGEKYISYYASLLGFEPILLRYANIYGPRQNPEGEAGVISIFIDKMLKGQNPIINGTGSQTRDYVYVEDIVTANLLALKNNCRGVFNVGTGIETDVNELFLKIQQLMKTDFQKMNGPAKAGEQQRSSISSSLLEKEWKWKPSTSLDAGLQETIHWFQSRH